MSGEDELQAQLDAALATATSQELKAKSLERELELLKAEMYGTGDGAGESRLVLADAKSRLEKENERLALQLEEATSARTALELGAQQNKSELSFVKDVLQEDAKAKADKLEQDRRRLQTIVSEQAEKLRASESEVDALKRAKASLAEERDKLQVLLDDALSDKNEEATGRRKALSQYKDAKMRLEVEQVKANDLAQQAITWRSKAQAVETELAAFLLTKDKAGRQESQAQVLVKELQLQLKEAQDARRKAEEASIAAADQVDDLKERLDEDAEELASLSRAKRQLEVDLAEAKNVTSREIQVREKALAELRERALKDQHQLSIEVESSQSTTTTLRSQVKELQSRLEALTQQLEEESRGKQSAQREAERQTLRATDQQRAYREIFQASTQLREEIASLNEQLAKAKEATADLDLLDSLERSKAQGDKKLQEALLENERLTRENASLVKKQALLSQELSENNELIEEHALATVRAEEKLRKMEFQLAEQLSLRKRDLETHSVLEKANTDLVKENREITNQILLIESTMALQGPRTRRQFDDQVTQLQEQLEATEQKLSEAEKAIRKSNKNNSEVTLRAAEADKLRLQAEDLVAKLESQVRKLSAQVDELENILTDKSIALKRSQREAEDAHDKAHKFERELNRFKSKMSRLSDSSSH